MRKRGKEGERTECHTENCFYFSTGKTQMIESKMKNVFREEIGLHFVKRSMGAGEIGIPVSPRDSGAVCGCHGDFIG